MRGRALVAGYLRAARRNHGRSRSNTIVRVAILDGRVWYSPSGTGSSDRQAFARVFPSRFVANWATQNGIAAKKIFAPGRRQLNGLRNRPSRSIERCGQRACAWRCDVMALPRLKQHAIASQALQHQPAGSGIQLPKAACLGEREPQSGHLAKLSAHTQNQSFHRHTTFPMSFYGRTIGKSTRGISKARAVS